VEDTGCPILNVFKYNNKNNVMHRIKKLWVSIVRVQLINFNVALNVNRYDLLGSMR